MLLIRPSLAEATHNNSPLFRKPLRWHVIRNADAETAHSDHGSGSGREFRAASRSVSVEDGTDQASVRHAPDPQGSANREEDARLPSDRAGIDTASISWFGQTAMTMRLP